MRKKPAQKTNPKKKKSSTTTSSRSRKTSVLKTKLKRGGTKTEKKKIYFTGSKNGKATYGTKPNKNIIGSVGAPKKKRR